MSHGTREIGTAYRGKEPTEYVVDVLRAIVREPAGELGFEACLTSRPFTARTFDPGNLGCITPGRGTFAREARVRTDLEDGLKTLEAFGWRTEPMQAKRTALFDTGLLLAGPIQVPDRFSPLADRLLAGGAWRFLIVEQLAGNEAVCLDPVFGGYTTVPQDLLAASPSSLLYVHRPTRAPDIQKLALHCLREGTTARMAIANPIEPAALRDAAGIERSAAVAQKLISAGPKRRLRLSLQNYALHALNWSILLSKTPAHDFDIHALADILRDIIEDCRDAYTATEGDDPAMLAHRLLQMAASADAVTELAFRINGRQP